MSTPAQKANLARIRDNQRRSRARKREYVQELEQRLRTCELQGIEASSEVQAAARRVAEENRHLRDLLHKQGLSDEYITHYLQSALGSQPAADLGPSSLSNPSAPFQPPGSRGGESVRSLQQALEPRRPTGLEPSAPYPVAGEASREASITSASTGVSSLWETSPQQPVPAGFGHHNPINMPPTALTAQAVTQTYSTPIYSGGATARLEVFSGHTLQQQHQQHPQQQQQLQQGGLVADTRSQGFLTQQIPPGVSGSTMGYTDPNSPFQQNARHYGPPGDYR